MPNEGREGKRMGHTRYPPPSGERRQVTNAEKRRFRRRKEGILGPPHPKQGLTGEEGRVRNA